MPPSIRSATTHAMEGATDFNSVGVKNYRSLDQGLDAARDTLQGGADSYGYEAILRISRLRLGGGDRDGDQRVGLVPRLYRRRLHHRPVADRAGELRRPRRRLISTGSTGVGPDPVAKRCRTARLDALPFAPLLTCHDEDSWTR